MTLTIDKPARQRGSGGEFGRLLESATRGSREAWEELVEEFGGMVWAVARSHRLSDADAADVAQTTWLRLLEHLGEINEPARVGAWLATTARRECLRVLRVSQRDVLWGDEPVELESPGAPPDEALLVAERDQMLWRCFACLRPSDQALLRLLVVDPQPSYEEISAALDMPIGSIGPTRARALDRLRKELERESALSLMAD
jgi:RNA polymerase sigma factor (sigma-70 family)